jgi:hypothetical protein
VALVAMLAPTAKLSGVGVGVGVGFGFDGGAGVTGAAHPVTLITGTVPEDVNATEHPAGAFTVNGTVRLTVPLVAVLAALGAGVCAVSGEALVIAEISAVKNKVTKCNLLVIAGPF